MLSHDRYSDSVLLRETIRCFVEDHEIKLGPRKTQYQPVLFRFSGKEANPHLYILEY